MNATDQHSDYLRIAQAIEFLALNAERQPSLTEVADSVCLSPYHFQRLFCRWAGVTPKRFLQALTVERAKKLLEESKPLLEVSETLGLSSGSRLHDHFVQLEAVTPGEFKAEGRGLKIAYGTHPSLFGRVFVAQTPRGICKVSFLDAEASIDPAEELAQAWPYATLEEDPESASHAVRSIFGRELEPGRPLSLHVAGTNFQISVWRALLRIPFGETASYRQIAHAIGSPGSAQAVGQAVGANPVGFAIPCHRVIRQNADLGGYRWGAVRKRAILAWEGASREAQQSAS